MALFIAIGEILIYDVYIWSEGWIPSMRLGQFSVRLLRLVSLAGLDAWSELRLWQLMLLSL